jgi:D-alanyl-D-alanine carboxypeptidase (penicillin-binding protein 5/6)
MGAESGDKRNAIAAKLLDWGFANYGIYNYVPEKISDLKLKGGVIDRICVEAEEFSMVMDKGQISKIEYKINIPEAVKAPVKKGDKIGEIIFSCDGQEIGRSSIVATMDGEKIGFFDLFCRMLAKFLLK